jgi:hypothetical protein
MLFDTVNEEEEILPLVPNKFDSYQERWHRRRADAGEILV